MSVYTTQAFAAKDKAITSQPWYVLCGIAVAIMMGKIHDDADGS